VEHPAIGALELPVDAMRVDSDGRQLFGVNMVVLGTAPDRANWWTRDFGVLVTVDGRVVHDARAIAVVVANGQYLRGLDLVPRGHPGDGRLEVQAYAPTRRERAAVRARLPQGVHLPHPRITQVVGRRVEIRADRALIPMEVDGVPGPPGARIVVEVVPEAFALLV
jgi:diacylglycerol kinase family enzyme